MARSEPAGYLSLPVPMRLDPFVAAYLARQLRLTPAEVAALFRMLTVSDVDADKWCYRSLTEFIAHHTDSPRVTALLGWLFGLQFIVPPEEMSAGETIYCFRRMLQDNSISYPRGGAKAVPLAYCRIGEEHGAEIRTRTAVRRVIIVDGRARGVELADGTRLDADLVVSTSSVRSTALHLCDPADLPASYVDAAKAVQGSLTAFQVKFALDKELVQSGCLIGASCDFQDLSDGADLLAVVMRDTRAGKVPAALPFYCPVPTNFDASLAPPGHQLLTACALAPTTDIDLVDPSSAWEEALTRTIRRIVPGLGEHTLFVDRTTASWMEHWNGKETGAAISTAQTPWQVGEHRPSVSTPVTGLYLAGDGAGGRGTGTELAADSAMECAERILADLRTVPASWNRPRHEAPTAPLHTRYAGNNTALTTSPA